MCSLLLSPRLLARPSQKWALSRFLLSQQGDEGTQSFSLTQLVS